MSGYYHITIEDMEYKAMDQVDCICHNLDNVPINVEPAYTDGLYNLDIRVPENKINTFMLTFFNHIASNRYWKITIQ